MKHGLAARLLAVFLAAPLVQAEMPNLTILTEEYVPFNFIDQEDPDKKIQGIAVDLLEEMLKKSGSSQTTKDISLVPWVRGYTNVQKDKNTLLFSTARTTDREAMFKWVCPIHELKTQLIALKSRAIKINNEADIQNYTVATVRDDVGEQLVLKAGVPEKKLDRAPKYSTNLKKLEGGRVDLFVESMERIPSMCKTLGCDPDIFEVVYTMNVSQLCYALNKNTDDKVVQSLQKSLDEILAEGRLKALHEKYEKWL